MHVSSWKQSPAVSPVLLCAWTSSSAGSDSRYRRRGIDDPNVQRASAVEVHSPNCRLRLCGYWATWTASQSIHLGRACDRTMRRVFILSSPATLLGEGLKTCHQYFWRWSSAINENDDPQLYDTLAECQEKCAEELEIQQVVDNLDNKKYW